MKKIELLKLNPIKKELEKLQPRDGILQNVKRKCHLLAAAKNAMQSKIFKRRQHFARTVLSAISLVVIVFFAAVLVSFNQFRGPDPDGTLGLKYKLIDNNFYEVSIGSAIDKDIIIPLTYNNIPVKRIAKTGFMNTDIESITMTDNITSVDGKTVSAGNDVNEGAFYGCKNLTNIIFSKKLVSIGAGAFTHCKSLKSIEIPNELEFIGSRAFVDCSSLTRIKIPKSVIIIGSRAFENCTISTSVASKLDGWAEDWNGNSVVEWKNELEELDVVYVLIDGGYEVFKSNSTAAEIEILNVYNGLPVISIGNSAFKDSNTLISITLPLNVKNIGESAFNNCINLNKVNILGEVLSIRNFAFSSCDSLTDINIPNSVKLIGDGAFSNCKSLESITLPEGINNIENSTFKHCSSLESITLPNGLNRIGSGAFEYCSNLNNVTLPVNLADIGSSAFNNSIDLESILIPESVEKIGINAFSNCQKLKIYADAITEPEGWQYGWNGNRPVEWKDIYLDYKLVSGEYEVSEGVAVSKIVIPSTYRGIPVTGIADYAFEYSNIENIIIPSSITKIGKSAFNNCSGLNSIVIPSTVTKIGSNAFGNCNSLTIYTAATYTTIMLDPYEWAPDWKGSYCLIIWACELSRDKTYVISIRITQDIILGATYNEPYREGFTFKGWAESAGGDPIYTMSNIYQAYMDSPNTTLYTVWEKI